MDSRSNQHTRDREGDVPKMWAYMVGQKTFLVQSKQLSDKTMSRMFRHKPTTTEGTAMKPPAPTYFCDDAADNIAQLIEDEAEKKAKATRTRDLHRSETSIRAYKEALRVVLLEKACATDGQQHEMPDVDEYLAGRAQAA